MAKSEDYEELAYVWKQYREVAGKPTRELYNQRIDLSNKAALANGTYTIPCNNNYYSS